MIARVREAVFNVLADRVVEARVADLYAGTGAIGLEALSRGAAHVEAWESGREPVRVLRSNAEALGVSEHVTLHRRPLPDGVEAGAPFDLVFVDPPWGKGLGAPAAQAVRERERLAPEALVVMEERAGRAGDATFWEDRGFEVVDRRRYGDSEVVLLAAL